MGWSDVVLVTCGCGAAGAAGWWLQGSSLLRRAVADAKAGGQKDRPGGVKVFDGQTAPAPPGEPLVSDALPRVQGAPQMWALVAVICAGSVAGALLARSAASGVAPGGLGVARYWLVVWATMAGLLGLVDLHEMVVPTWFARSGTAVTACLCAVFCAWKRDWVPLAQGGACGFIGWAAFGAWAVAAPAKLGFGDARMAALVGFGAGAAWAGGALAALACAPLAAGAAGTWRSRRAGGGDDVASPHPLEAGRQVLGQQGPGQGGLEPPGPGQGAGSERAPTGRGQGSRRPVVRRPVALGPFLAFAGIAAVVARAA